MSKVRMGFSGDEGDAFPPHYVTDVHRTRTAQPVGEEEMGPTVVPLDLDQATAMLLTHMKAFEVGAGDLDIDGYRVPMKAAARLYIDAITTLLLNHGVRPNLNLIRTDLCPGCFGSQAAAKEFLQNKSMTPDGVTHSEQPGSM